METQLAKAAFMFVLASTEAVFQSMQFSLGDFMAVNPALQPLELVEVRLVFDRVPSGTIVLDHIGIQQDGPPGDRYGLGN